MSIVEINHEIQELENKIWRMRVSADILQNHEKRQIEIWNNRIYELRQLLKEEESGTTN